MDANRVPQWDAPGGPELPFLALRSCVPEACPHETAIAHIRRLLDTDFAYTKLHETPEHFRRRMQQVEDHMNSDAFAAPGGQGLLGLAKELRSRCEEMIRRGGQRVPK